MVRLNMHKWCLSRWVLVVAGLLLGATAGNAALRDALEEPLDSEQILDIAKRLETRLKYIRNEELCVPKVQEKFDLMDFVTRPRNDEEQLQRIVTKLEGKLRSAFATLDSLEQATMTTVNKLSMKSETVVYPCPSRISAKVRLTAQPISNSSSSSREEQQMELIVANSGQSVEEDFSGQFYKQLKGLQFTTRGSNSQGTTSSLSPLTAPNFKRQYLLSPHDNAIDNRCPFYFDTRPLRNVFVSSIKNKRVLLLLDHGNSLNLDQLELTKAMAKQIVSLLSDSDYLQILTISEVANQFTMDQKSFRSPDNDCDGGESRINGMFPASMDNKVNFLKFIDQLGRTKENTNHSLGFQKVFDFLATEFNSTDDDDNEEVLFLYISRGLLSMAEAKTVLETIAMGQSKLKQPLIINTCAIIIDEKRIMYERHFLTDVTIQDYAKYNIDTPWKQGDAIRALEGHMYVAMKRQSHALFVNATAFFAKEFLARETESSVEIHRPVVDTEVNRDLIVSVTKTIKNVGVIGLDLYLHDLAEDVLYYNKHPDSYAFLIDNSGKVIVHPTQIGHMIVDGPYQQEFMYPTDVLFFEQNRGFFDDVLRSEVLKAKKGKKQFQDNIRNGTITYTWKSTEDQFYIVCIVTYRSNSAPRHPVELKRIHSFAHNRDVYPSLVSVDSLLYHRLDLLMALMKRGPGLSPGGGGGGGSFGGTGPKLSLCRNFKQISTFDAGTLFLSPLAFQSPFLFTKNNNFIRRTMYSTGEDLDADEQQVAMDRIQTLMAYLKDRTNLLANPGVLSQVRNDVVALSYIINHLRWKHLQREHPQHSGPIPHTSGDGTAEDESLRRAIIRRYIATMNGVLEVYPGVQLDGTLEPSRRPWFVKALKYPGKVVLTEPYLDAGGAGYIISIAYTIFEGKPTALHNAEKDLPVAVIGLDVTLGYIYKLVAESSGGLCGPGGISSSAAMRCFLIDDKGYLVAHPSVLQPNIGTGNRGPLEHVTHKEPLVANDLLSHKILVEKKSCNVYGNRTTQRYYQFNTSMVDVLSNGLVHGERNKYHITLIPGTNVFLIIVNASTEGGAFCPCSMVDRLCFNCYRMEHAECECPCECPLGVVPEIGRESCYEKNSSFNPFEAVNCDLPHMNVEESNVNTVMPIFRYDFDEMEMRSCPTIACDQLGQQWECLGVAGCEWCQMDDDGETIFSQPFCTMQSSCYGGVLGAGSPYGGGGLGSGILGENQMGATIFIDPLNPPTYSSVGPVAGAIIALCLVVGFAMYCYRQNQEPHIPGPPFEEHFYVESQNENNYDVAMNRMNFEDAFDNNDGNNSNQNLIPVNGADVASTSPYRAPSAYRRPTNTDSDHGYSTMTPHDDSENAGFTLADPLLNRGRPPGQKRASMSDTMSISTSVSSPTNFQKHYNVPLRNDVMDVGVEIAVNVSIDFKDTGALLANQNNHGHSPHHVLVPVTVHRQMEAI